MIGPHWNSMKPSQSYFESDDSKCIEGKRKNNSTNNFTSTVHIFFLNDVISENKILVMFVFITSHKFVIVIDYYNMTINKMKKFDQTSK